MKGHLTKNGRIVAEESIKEIASKLAEMAADVEAIMESISSGDGTSVDPVGLYEIAEMVGLSSFYLAEMRDDDRTNIGEIATAILNLRKTESFAIEEMAAFHAPQECWPNVQRVLRDSEKRILATYELTPVRWNRIVYKTTREYVAFETGLFVSD